MGKSLVLYEFNGNSDYHMFDAKITSKSLDNKTISITVYGKSKCSRINLDKSYNFPNLELYDLPSIFDINSNIYYLKYFEMQVYYAEDNNNFNEIGIRVMAALIGRKVCGNCAATLYSNLNNN